MNALPFPARLLVFCAVCILGGEVRAAEPEPAPVGKGRAEHVVVVVWDGMRPDFVSEEHTPTLAKLAGGGVVFTRHHSVYPTSTEVNGTALATGCYPGHGGILGNREYRPAIDPVKPVATEAIETVRRGDAVTGGRYIAVPTLPELLHAAGRRTAVAGTKPVALLWDRAEREDPTLPEAVRESPVVFAGNTLPRSLGAEIERTLGVGFPMDVKFPNTVADQWTTRALTEVLWRDEVPAFSVLWLSEPDYSQHQTGPGASMALAAIRGSDDCLRRVLEALDAKGVREKTDVIIVSDHGFSTVTRTVDTFESLKAAGLPMRRVFDEKNPPQPGDILVSSLGGSVAYYVAGHEPESTRRLVETLQQSDFAGVIFTREPLPGTFPLAAAHLENANAPDVLMAMRWSEEPSEMAHARGTILAEGRKPGQGTHATLSPFDLHNTGVAAGPDFLAGKRTELPSGNVDVTPTVAWLLGLKNLPAQDGRVLREALRDGNAPLPTVRTADGPSATQKFPKSTWSQRLTGQTVGNTHYLDEGNGGSKSE